MTEQSSELKRLNFAEGFLTPTLIGEKEITLRKYREGSHDFSKGEIVAGLFQEGGDQWQLLLKITANTEKKPFNQITDEEAVEDGFLDAEDAFEGMQEYYPGLTREQLMAIIRFRIPEINGRPIIQFFPSPFPV